MVIATLNELARTAMGRACRLVQSAGINALEDQSTIRERVAIRRFHAGQTTHTASVTSVHSITPKDHPLQIDY
jgi:hypothetical protein